jgi:hypothetical protein
MTHPDDGPRSDVEYVDDGDSNEVPPPGVDEDDEDEDSERTLGDYDMEPDTDEDS